jgi:sugar phosphate isomerase/epimerase
MASVKQTVPLQSHERGEVSLLELPARLAEFGVHTLEVCHFHLPSRDAQYLAALRGAMEAANVELWSLLIDDGDLSHAENGARDAQHIARG